jgi:phage shock protein PspC (stress-responsive transcriptional regulator)
MKITLQKRNEMMKYEREFSPNQYVNKTLSKDSLHKKISGVCAGIAKHYDLPRIAVRIAAIGALILLPVATGVAYVVASVLLPESKYR